MSHFMKIGPVGAELFYADGRTDKYTEMTKRIVAFRSFANAPKNEYGHFHDLGVDGFIICR
jgi:hypothetical protein